MRKNSSIISVIVPAYNSEDYIKDCIESIANQTYKFFEMIIVNDGSTDNTKKIIEQYQKKYKWLKLINIKNHGQGYARNLGLKEAMGKYVLFLDADDILSFWTLEKSYNKIISDNSDICSFKWSKFRNETKSNVKNRQNLFLPDKSLLVGEECLDMLYLIPYYTVNNLYDREFLLNNDIKYGEGYIYEDVPFWLKAVTKAKKISILDEKLYIIRINTKSTTNVNYQTDQHYKSYLLALDECIKYLKNNKNRHDYNGFYRYSLDKFLYYYNKRVPKTYRNDFISGYVKIMKGTKIENKKNVNLLKIAKKLDVFNGNSKLKLKLLIIIYYLKRKYNLLRRKRILKFLKLIRKNVRQSIIDKYYNSKIDKNIVFIQSKNCSDLASNMFYITKEIYENYKNYKVIIPLDKDKILNIKQRLNYYNINVKIIKSYTLKYYKYLYKSKYLFTDSTFFRNYLKKDDQIIINTWHGTALKKMGKDNIESAFEIDNVQKNFLISDYLVYPNKFMENQFLDAYMVRDLYKGTILNVGYPRNSIFFDRKREKDLRELLHLNDKKIYIYMPTWRGVMTNKENEKQIKIIDQYLQYIDNNLKDNQIFYVKLHLFVNSQIDFTKFTKIKPFPKDLETYDFLNLADVLITDYSSVFFDFANTGKKIVLFAYDEDEYLSSRGLYLKFEELPFPIVKKVEDLIEELNNENYKKYSDFQKKYCEFDSYDATKKLCKIVFNKQNNRKKMNKKYNLVYISDGNMELAANDYFIYLQNNPDFNYYFLIGQQILKNNLSFVKILNEKVNYIPLTNKIFISLIEKIRIKIFNDQKTIEKLLSRESLRNFGNISFNKIIYIGKENKYKKIIEKINHNKFENK